MRVVPSCLIILFFCSAQFEGGEAEEGADDAGDPEADDDGVFGGVGGAAFGAGVFLGDDFEVVVERGHAEGALFGGQG